MWTGLPACDGSRSAPIARIKHAGIFSGTVSNLHRGNRLRRRVASLALGLFVLGLGGRDLVVHHLVDRSAEVVVVVHLHHVGLLKVLVNLHNVAAGDLARLEVATLDKHVLVA